MLRLVCANLNYSSWSMRPWLALEQAGAEFKIHDVSPAEVDHFNRAWHRLDP